MVEINREDVNAFGDALERVKRLVEANDSMLYDFDMGRIQFMFQDKFMVFVITKGGLGENQYFDVLIIKKSTWEKLAIADYQEKIFARAVKRGNAKTFCCSRIEDVFRTLHGEIKFPIILAREETPGRKIRL